MFISSPEKTIISNINSLIDDLILLYFFCPSSCDRQSCLCIVHEVS